MENDTERVQSAPEDDDPERLTSKSNTTTADSTRSYGLLKNRLDVNEAGHDPEEEIISDTQPEITDNPDSNGEDTREENGVLLPEQSNITDDVKTSELECLDDVELPDELIRQLSGVDKIELMSPRSRSLDQENQFELWRRLADVSRRQEEAISWR
ncbi:hypothetical protein LSH36_540g01071 [Paralvinella palmiformis]|uniref:Uncharacterized protein n=1 Tax=Paralvinella palmiformis TaxID=53620 RepID=A0AAD9J7S6_9ANNE|nr:hypothetical protein LSH36_540g01071 [Paralvinella palmiformis]